MIECAHCQHMIEEDPVDTTYSNYNSGRAYEGQHTGNIYSCNICDEKTLDNFLSGNLEPWSYN